MPGIECSYERIAWLCGSIWNWLTAHLHVVRLRPKSWVSSMSCPVQLSNAAVSNANRLQWSFWLVSSSSGRIWSYETENARRLPVSRTYFSVIFFINWIHQTNDQMIETDWLIFRLFRTLLSQFSNFQVQIWFFGYSDQHFGVFMSK